VGVSASEGAHAASTGRADWVVDGLDVDDRPGAGAAAERKIPLVPQSLTDVGNAIPFGNNTRFGFTGFIYRNVPPFVLRSGDTFAFDLGSENGTLTLRNIYFAQADKNPHFAVLYGSNVVSQGITARRWVQVVSDAQIPSGGFGDQVVGDSELRYRAEAAFTFQGGGLIIGFGASPPGDYADRGGERVLVRTTALDGSGHFYARFCNRPDLDRQVLDEVQACSGNGAALGGVIIHADLSAA
jgi:hypothetical protein